MKLFKNTKLLLMLAVNLTLIQGALASGPIGPYVTCFTDGVNYMGTYNVQYQEIAMKQVGNRYFAIQTQHSSTTFIESMKDLFGSRTRSKFTPVFEVQAQGRNNYINSENDFDVSFSWGEAHTDALFAESMYRGNVVALICENWTAAEFESDLEIREDLDFTKAKKELFDFNP